MSGTLAGGQRAAATNRRIYGEDFYKKIGAKGGRNGRTGGFAYNNALARVAGRKGGKVSRRTEGKEWWEKYGDQVMQLLQNGWSYTAIEKEIGKRGIYYLAHKYGVAK